MAATLASFDVSESLSTTAVKIVSTTLTEKKFIGGMVFTNNSTSTSRLVRVYRLSNGVSPSASNVLDRRTIQPQGTWIPDTLLGQNIQQGAAIWADQDSGTDVINNGSGVLET